MPQQQFNIHWPSLIDGNLSRVRAAMSDNDVSVLVANHIDNVRYLTGYSPVSAPLLVLSNWFVLDGRTGERALFGFNFYVDSIRAQFPWLPDVRPLSADMPTAIADWLREHGHERSRVAFDGHLNHFDAVALQRQLPEVELADATPWLMTTRAIKSDAELNIIRRAVAIGEIGMKAGIDACLDGQREYEVAARAEFAMRSAGAEGFPVSSVVTSGENAALMQELSTDKFLRHGEVVFLDLGCMFEGYYSDFCRTVVVGGGRGTSEQQDIYRTLATTCDELIRAARPGVSCGDLESIAQKVIADAGYSDHTYKHPLGHGLGMSVWEYPALAPGSETELAAGMVIDIEPGIYKPGVGGFRIEQTLLITSDEPEVLTQTELCTSLL